MAHDVSEPEVDPGNLGADQPALTRQPTSDGTEAPPGTRVDATEAEAREVAEAARETEWDRPSFAKGLYLGPVRPLPDPPAPARRPPTTSSAARRSSPSCARSARSSTASAIEREDRIPDDYLKALADIGAFGMKIPQRVRRPRADHGLLRQGADAGRLGAPEPRRAGVGAPVDRRTRAGEDVRHRGAEAAVPAPLRRRARSPRSCSPSPTSAPTRPGWPRRPRSPRTARRTCSTA